MKEFVCCLKGCTMRHHLKRSMPNRCRLSTLSLKFKKSSMTAKGQYMSEQCFRPTNPAPNEEDGTMKTLLTITSKEHDGESSHVDVETGVDKLGPRRRQVKSSPSNGRISTFCDTKTRFSIANWPFGCWLTSYRDRCSSIIGVTTWK